MYFLGISEAKRIAGMSHTRDAVIALIATALACEVAEELVTGQYSGGKSNDIANRQRSGSASDCGKGLIITVG